ncbi:hypothetical protein Goklo_019375, partial [Gossypium klotzschianum]|nr:hypothetical protein [Gossypium klotzschianum]
MADALTKADILRPSHWKPVGTFLEQTLRSKLREIGMLRLMPKMLALIAVQRQAAASRSTRPLRREQHGITGGEPTVTLTKLSTLAHTPNLRASLGHLPRADGVGVGVGLGLEPEEEQDPQLALTREKKRMLMKEEGFYSASSKASGLFFNVRLIDQIKWRIVGAKCWRYWHVVNGCFVAGFDWECHGRALEPTVDSTQLPLFLIKNEL